VKLLKQQQGEGELLLSLKFPNIAASAVVEGILIREALVQWSHSPRLIETLFILLAKVNSPVAQGLWLATTEPEMTLSQGRLLHRMIAH